MPPISLDLAGWRLCLEVDSPELARGIEARYAAFGAPAGHPSRFIARVSVGAGSAARRTTPTTEVGLRRVAVSGAAHRLDAPGFSAWIDPEQGTGELMLESGVPLADLEHFLRVAVALLAFQEGGLLIHAAGLGLQNGVYLFVGRSGSGKSTTVALSPQARVLNDDLIILRPHGDAWVAYGTPFWNVETARREGQTDSGPAVGIYRLVQDSAVYLEPLPPAIATAELVANCPVLNGSPAHLEALLLRCRQLAAAVPVQRLHFRKDGAFWNAIEAQAQETREDHRAAQ
jgi:hypothetical protein